MIEVLYEASRASTFSPFWGVRIDTEKFALGSNGVFVEGKKGAARITIYDEHVSQSAVTQRLSDIDPAISTLQLWPRYSRLGQTATHQGVSVIRESEDLIISWDVHFHLIKWKERFSVTEYVEEFLSTLENNRNKFEGDVQGPGFSILFRVEDKDATIEQEFLKHVDEILELEKITTSSLASKSPPASLLMSFDFPEEVRVPCEQYLLYFAQFLKDLGVEANTEVTHKAGQVLFTVTPRNEEHALDNIRSALDLYLRFPSSPISDTDSEPIAIQRLESNILHLRSELKLAAAEVQAKNATIEAQQLTIAIQKRLLNGEIMVDSIKDVTPKAEDKEPLLGGVVALATLKEKGVEINLGELFRKIRSLFSKNTP